MEKERGEDVFSLESLGKNVCSLKIATNSVFGKFSSSSGQYDTKQLFFFNCFVQVNKIQKIVPCSEEFYRKHSFFNLK
jgi:hypothetical protein